MNIVSSRTLFILKILQFTVLFTVIICCWGTSRNPDIMNRGHLNGENGIQESQVISKSCSYNR